jgi:3-isopropylmalate dehydratase
MSPVMAAACALVGKLADVRNVASAAHVSPAKASPKITVADLSWDNILTDEDMDRIIDLPEEAGANADAETGAPAPAPAPSRGMVKFTQLKGIAAPMDRANVDTDAIIPKQFLKTIKRSGLGTALFHQWRYDSETGKENPDFILNKEPYRNAKILVVTGANFGCGSSREHAPWALLDFGIRCIIAQSFVSTDSTPTIA